MKNITLAFILFSSLFIVACKKAFTSKCIKCYAIDDGGYVPSDYTAYIVYDTGGINQTKATPLDSLFWVANNNKWSYYNHPFPYTTITYGTATGIDSPAHRKEYCNDSTPPNGLKTCY